MYISVIADIDTAMFHRTVTVFIETDNITNLNILRIDLLTTVRQERRTIR